MDNFYVQQRLIELENSHKKVIIWSIVIIVVLLITMAIIVYKGYNKPVPYNDKALVTAIDSMKVHDKQRATIDSQQVIRQYNDSVRYTAIYTMINNTHNIVNAINTKYNAQRNHLSTLSADDQLSYLSTWLSQEDSSRH